MKLLYLIPARSGSKGIPGKNTKSLAGKPLLYYAIDLARCIAKEEDICLSTDSLEIIDVAQKTYTLEAMGDDRKITSLIEMLRPLGIKELVRSGKVAITREPITASSK